MKTKRRLMIIPLVALVLAGCATMPEVKKLTPATAASADEIEYWLPKTVLQAELPLKHTLSKRAALLPTLPETQKKYFELLKKELNLDEDNVQKENVTRVALDEDGKPVISSRAERDPSARFAAKLKVRWWQTLKTSMEFSDDQIMQSASVDATNQALPIIVKTIKTVAEVAGAVVLNKPADVQTLSAAESKRAKTEMKLAERAVARVLELRKLREKFYTQPKDYADAAQLKMAQDWITAQEQAVLGKLLGTQEETLWTARLDFEPTEATTSGTKQTPAVVEAELGKIYETKGFEPVASGNGKQCPFFYKGSTGETGFVSLKIEVTRAPSQLVATAARKATERGSLAYRVPELTEVTLLAGEQELCKEKVLVAQLGQLRQLPHRLGTVQGSYVATLDGKTGALKKIETAATAAAVADHVETLGAAAKARIEANNPTKKLEDEKAYLEAFKAVKELKEALQKADDTVTAETET